MKKKNVWLTDDGLEFTTQEEAFEHERTVGFEKACRTFFQKHSDNKKLQEISLQDLISVLQNNSLEFQEIINLAKPKKRRGRPPKIKEISEENILPKLETSVLDPINTLAELPPALPAEADLTQAEPTESFTDMDMPAPWESKD